MFIKVFTYVFRYSYLKPHVINKHLFSTGTIAYFSCCFQLQRQFKKASERSLCSMQYFLTRPRGELSQAFCSSTNASRLFPTWGNDPSGQACQQGQHFTQSYRLIWDWLRSVCFSRDFTRMSLSDPWNLSRKVAV